MSKSNFIETSWLIPRGKDMSVITEDAMKYNYIKPYIPSVPEKEHKETEQTKIRRRRTRRLIRNYTVCIQEIIFEKGSK